MRNRGLLVSLLSRTTVYTLLWVITLLYLFSVIVLWNDIPSENDNNPPEIPEDTSLSPLTTEDPDVNNFKLVPKSDHPTIVRWNSFFRVAPATIQCPNYIKCETYERGYRLRQDVGGAYIFYASALDFVDVPIPRRPHNILWVLNHEESPRNVELLLHDTTLSLFNFSTTFSRQSDVPFPLFYMGSIGAITSKDFYVETCDKNSLLNDLAPILYIQSDCETSTERDDYVKQLMMYIRVDSYGKCLQNKPELPLQTETNYINNLDDENYLRFIARYKFHISIENGVCVDYVTEKFWRPIKVGSVPIYFGSPLVKDWFPNNKSAILIEDFPTPRLMSKYLQSLIDNDTLYEEYLEHKTKGVVNNKRIFEEISERPYQLSIHYTHLELECFVCKKLHEMRNKPFKSIVTKKHYDCPIPISALSLDVNPDNMWVKSYYENANVSSRLFKLIRDALDIETYQKQIDPDRKNSNDSYDSEYYEEIDSLNLTSNSVTRLGVTRQE